ncbi:MAG: dephospho-CoA kinase [Sulfurovum sp.]|nr:dephospho-CoA kinase [Sulfurovum sp.]
MRFEHAIVLTGGIATGKSTVSDIFSGYGFDIIDADKVAHEVLDVQIEKISEIFGDDYISYDKVKRKELGRLVFSDKIKLKKLENLLHPLIQKEIESRAKLLDDKTEPYLIDIPLFFESENYAIEKSILVYAPRDTQLIRLTNRDGYSEKEAEKRINSQMDIDKKKTLATFIIDNSKDIGHLEKECERVRDLILNRSLI